MNNEIIIKDSNGNEGIWESENNINANYNLVSLTGIPTILPKITYVVKIKVYADDCWGAGVSYCDKAFFRDPIVKICKTFEEGAVWAQEKLTEIVERYEQVSNR